MREKVWKCDLRQLASSWVSGRVPEAPIEDILKSAIGSDTKGYAHQSVFWFPRKGGFETLVRGTVAGSGFDLQCGVSISRVERKGSQFAVDGELYDLVVNTVPLPLAEPLFGDIPEAIRQDVIITIVIITTVIITTVIIRMLSETRSINEY